MNAKLFLLLLSINIVSAHDQLHKETTLEHQSSQIVTEGARVSDEMRKIVLEAAPDEVKKLIKIVKDPNSPADLKPRRILLYGPSGCGKTTLAQVFAQEAGLPCVFIAAALLGNECENSASSNLRKAIEQHLSKPCVIVLDEIGLLLKKAKENKEDVAQVINILDTLNKHPHITLIGTTNYLKEIEQPLQTRFAADTIQVKAEQPYEIRKKILFTHLKGVSNNFCCCASCTKKIIDLTKGYSIREVESLVRWARTCAYDQKHTELCRCHFIAAHARLEAGRKAISNEQSWKEFLASNAKWTGKYLAVGCVQGVGFKIVQTLLEYRKATRPWLA